jgi:UDP-N-acetylenolpyruvoylglucosamine reductase
LLPVATQVSSLHANFLVNAGARGGGGAGATAAELRALIEAIRCQVIRRCKKWRIVI